MEHNFENIFWNLLESTGENCNASVFRLPMPLREKAIQEIDRCVEKYKGEIGIDQLEIYKNNLINVTSPPATEYFLDEIKSLELLQPYHKTFKDIWPSLYKGLIKC